MTNYTKTTDFAAKDSLPSGNAAKIVKGSEIDTEFNNIATASATKANSNDAVLTGTTTAQTLDISGNVDVDGTLETDALSLNGVTVTSTAAELNILDGVTSTAAELNILDGVTSTTAELNILDGVTSTTAELNILDGVTATTAELNYVDGVTSAIQTQLDAKAPTASPTFTGNVTVQAAGELRIRDDGTFIKEDQGLQIGNTSGTGTTRPIRFFTESAERMRVDSGGGINKVSGSGATLPAIAAGLLAGEFKGSADSAITNDSGFLRLSAGGGTTVGVKAGIDIFRGSTDGSLIRMFTSGSERLRVDSSGNVGIGVTSMAHPLVIQNSTPIIQLIDSNLSTRVAKIGGENGNVTIDIDPNQAEGTSFFSVDIDNTERMVLDASGDLTVKGGRIFVNENDNGNIAVAITRDADEGYVNLYSSGTQKIEIRGNGNSYFNGGNVGIGTTNPLMNLHLSSSGDTGIQITKDGSVASRIKTVSGALAIGVDGANGDTERMRIDSSGNLLVSKTAVNTSTVGVELRETGKGMFTASGTDPLFVNRLSSDGDIAKFFKDNGHVGSIGTLSGDLNIGSGDTGLDFSAGLDAIMPYNPSTNGLRDNTIDLGQSSVRFDDIYATNGTIQTSDRNEKQDIEALSDAEQRVAVAAKGLLRKFRWKSSVAENGDEARIHFGIIAQDLQAAFEAEGLDAGRYAMFINSTWTDEETGEERTRMGVRYSELLAFIIAAI